MSICISSAVSSECMVVCASLVYFSNEIQTEGNLGMGFLMC